MASTGLLIDFSGCCESVTCILEELCLPMFAIIPDLPVVLKGSTAYIDPDSTVPRKPWFSLPQAYDGTETLHVGPKV